VSVSIERGIEFARHDGVAIKGDLYRPSAGKQHPIVVAFHGGGWQIGGPERYIHWGPWLAERGFALFAATYRLAREGAKTWPAAFHDCRAAVQFVRANAERLGVDGARVALVGDSAGAHLASLVALAGDRPEFANAYPSDPYASQSTRVKAVIGVYGVYDMAAQWDHDLVQRPLDPITTKFLGAKLSENRRLYFDASPLSYVTSDNNQTAFLVAWGTADDIADGKRQSEPFLVALKQAGFFVRPAIVPNAPHFWMDDPVDEPGGYTAFLAPKLLRFLQQRV
jgi:acetyl esterase/lipase